MSSWLYEGISNAQPECHLSSYYQPSLLCKQSLSHVFVCKLIPSLKTKLNVANVRNCNLWSQGSSN